MRLHLLPALVVPEHCTLPDEERLLLVVTALTAGVVLLSCRCTALVVAAEAGLQTLQAVNPSACASATVVWKELFR